MSKPDSLISFEDWRPEVGPGSLKKARTWVVLPGDRLAIVGESGSGKSLLLRSWLGLEPAQGRRSVLGSEVISIPEFRRQVQFIPQTPFFEPRISAAEAIGVSDLQAKERARAELKDLGIADPESFLKRPADQASGGEKFRLAWVRARLLNPRVMVLDEPTSALDSANELKWEACALRWLDERPESRALVFTSHSPTQRARFASVEWPLD